MAIRALPWGHPARDFRESFKYKNRTVQEILAQALPVSFVLGGIAFVLATTGGVLLGTLAALRRNTWVDYSAMFLALLAISLPSFVTGPLVIMVFAIWLGWFPVGGWMEAASVVLPAIVLAAPFVAYIARLMRNSMLDVLQQEFMRTARAKGLSATQALYRHGLKVAILPVVTFLGPLAAHLLTGSIVVETIFSIPGAGVFFIRSIENRDGVLLCGVVIVYCALLVAFNFLVDMAYSFLDRRIKLYGEPS